MNPSAYQINAAGVVSPPQLQIYEALSLLARLPWLPILTRAGARRLAEATG